MILQRVGAAAMQGASRRPPPMADVLTYEWWDPETLVAGSIASYVGRKVGATWTAAGSARPTYSATSLGGYPGVTADGSANIMSCTTLGTYMSGRSSLTWTGAIITTGAGAQQIWEHTVNSATQNGGAGVSINALTPSVFGAVRSTLRGLTSASQSIATTPHVISIGLDTNVTNGVRFIRHNGTALSLTNVISSASPGNFANASMFLFARSGPTAGTLFAGTLGDFSIRSSVAQDGHLDAIERFYGARCGLSW